MTSGAVAGDKYVKVLDTTASTVTVGNVATYVAGIKTGAPATGGISCFKLDEGSMIVASCSDLRVMVSCTADGVPYYPGMRVAGGGFVVPVYAIRQL